MSAEDRGSPEDIRLMIWAAEDSLTYLLRNSKQATCHHLRQADDQQLDSCSCRAVAEMGPKDRIHRRLTVVRAKRHLVGIEREDVVPFLAVASWFVEGLVGDEHCYKRSCYTHHVMLSIRKT
jgi:hypothetical protein